MTRTEISDVPIFAFTYAWSQRSISYFLSTTGNNNPPLRLYRSQFEDKFYCLGWRDIPRPKFSNFIYDFLPLIDENNKPCENILNLNKCWPTKNFWFWLIATIFGMCVVVVYCLYLNSIKIGATKIQEFNIRKLSDLIWHTLSRTNYMPWYTFQICVLEMYTMACSLS